MTGAAGPSTDSRASGPTSDRAEASAAPEPPPAGGWMNAANAVSVFRLGLAPCSLVAVLGGHWRTAAAVFVVAVVSDFLDGILARRQGTVSPLGGLLDHTSDAIFVVFTLWALTYIEAQQRIDIVPGILPFFVALAFLQYLLDSRALAGRPLRASLLGRLNGIAYFVIAGVVVLRNALVVPVDGSRLVPQSYLAWLSDEAINIAALVVVVTTLLSMMDRLLALRRTRDPDE